MSKEKLLSVKPRSDVTRHLQSLLIDYHHFRMARRHSPLLEKVAELEQWQGNRLKHTHQDLYEHPRYREALDFLLHDLYTPTQFARRDDDLERIFPVMVKLVPESALGTVARLVELNLLTQHLDMAVATAWQTHYGGQPLTESLYARCFRESHRLEDRLRQVAMVRDIGEELESYVRSRFLTISLGMTQGAANVAGLGQLHRFLSQGMKAFRGMGQVSPLLKTLSERESALMTRIHEGEDFPFSLSPALVAEPAREQTVAPETQAPVR